MADVSGEHRARSFSASERVRDFLVLTLGAAGLLAILWASGALGLVEWLTGAIVVFAGALAYYVGSTPPARIETSRTGEDAAPTITERDIVGDVVAALPFPAIYIAPDNRIAHMNEAARTLYRASGDVQVLKSVVIRQPDILAASDRVAMSGAGERVEFRSGDNQEVWLAYLQPGPEPLSIFIVMEDLTAVHRAERARADFLANASHELRTPLTAVAGFIETMRGPASDDRDSWDGFLEIMHQQTERMRRLVADLLSLSRIEFSEHRPPDSRVDLADLVEKAVKSLQPIAAESDVSLSLSKQTSALPVIAKADEITQVLQNLVGNAVKYSPRGGEVRVILGEEGTMSSAARQAGQKRDGAGRAILLAPRASAEAPAVWLRVEDEGEGIPRKHLPRLGERFYRADESRGGDIEGTGLGLAIVKHIMSRHRGGFAVESKEGEGSVFGVWMPLDHQDWPQSRTP